MLDRSSAWHAILPRSATLHHIGRIAEDQWGLVTRRQASQAGVPQVAIQRMTNQGVLERVAHGVYRLSGAPEPDHLDLRAAWLQLAPEVLAWNRTAGQGVVSYRSAAALYGIGHLPAERHDFTLPDRRQSRRPTSGSIGSFSVRRSRPFRGLPVTRPFRIAADLIDDREDPEAVAYVIADAARSAYDYPGDFAIALGPYASHFGFRRGDGLALLRWLLDIIDDPSTSYWMQEASTEIVRAAATERDPRSQPSAEPCWR